MQPEPTGLLVFVNWFLTLRGRNRLEELKKENLVFKGTENYRIKGRILKPVQTAHLLTVFFYWFWRN